MTKSSAPRRRRIPVAAVIAIVLVAVVAAVEITARMLVSTIAAQQVEGSLPPSVSARVKANPTGWCVGCEVISGTLSGLDLQSNPLEFEGMQGAVSLHASDVRFRGDAQAGQVTGSLELTEEQFNSAIDQLAAGSGVEVKDVTLSDQGISYETTLSAFGRSLTVAVTGSVHSRGDGQLQIRGENVSITSPGRPAGINLDPGRFTFRMCIASQLPKELEVTRVTTYEGRLEILFRTKTPVPLDGTAFQTTGSC